MLQGPSMAHPQDSFRFFHRLCLDGGLSRCDVEQLLNMTLLGLRQMATDPDVANSGLAILADLGKTPGPEVQVFRPVLNGFSMGFQWVVMVETLTLLQAY